MDSSPAVGPRDDQPQYAYECGDLQNVHIT